MPLSFLSGIDLVDCKSPFYLKSGHLQTLAGELVPQPSILLPEAKRSVLDLDDKDQLTFLTYTGTSEYVVVMGHGLTGHAEAAYLKRLAFILNGQRKHTVVCFNHRNCGDGFGLAKGLYHSGRSKDFAQVVSQVRRQHPDKKVIAVGFSMSGNALLRLMGDHEKGGGREHSYPDLAISVNAPVDLAHSSRLINQGLNRIYQAHFMKGIRDLMSRQYYLGRLEMKPHFSFLNMSLFEFDDIFTGPKSGFAGAEDYYSQCSAKRFFRQINKPTIMITSEDDPFVAAGDYREASENAFVHLNVQKVGGHMGYIHQKNLPSGGFRWMDYAVDRYITAFVSAKDRC